MTPCGFRHSLVSLTTIQFPDLVWCYVHILWNILSKAIPLVHFIYFSDLTNITTVASAYRAYTLKGKNRIIMRKYLFSFVASLITFWWSTCMHQTDSWKTTLLWLIMDHAVSWPPILARPVTREYQFQGSKICYDGVHVCGIITCYHLIHTKLEWNPPP